MGSLPEVGSELASERVADAIDGLVDVGFGERAVRAEGQPVGEALLTFGERRTAIDVEQHDRLQELCARPPNGLHDVEEINAGD